jgi:Na+-translocating ferredoxin:NAD+ oxidoreductase subunit E
MSTSEPRPDDFSGSVPLLALCPALAVSDTVVNALGLGIAILIIIPTCFALTGAVRLVIGRRLGEDSVLAINVLLFAAVIACAELLMRAWFHDLRQALGIFLPLILANLAVLHELQTRATRAVTSAARAFKLSAYIAATLLILGIARELVGRGSLLHDAAHLLGKRADGLEMNVFSVDMGFLLAMLPPGAFIALGLLIAARNRAAELRATPRKT